MRCKMMKESKDDEEMNEDEDLFDELELDD